MASQSGRVSAVTSLSFVLFLVVLSALSTSGDAETTMNETTIETPSTPLSAAEGATADATSAVDREQDSSDGEEGGESEGGGEEGIEDEGSESEGSESEGGGEEGIEDEGGREEGGESEGSGEEGIEDEGVESEGSESEGSEEEGIEDEGGADEGPENKESLSVVEFPSNLTASHIVWFEKELRVPRGATEMTLCFFVNLMYFQGNQYVVVVMFSNKDGVYFKDGNLMSNFGDNYLKTRQPLAAWTWVHACLVLGRDMALVLDGEQVEVVRAPGGDFPEITSLTLNLPFASGRYSVLPFMGKITLPKVYYRQLSKDEMASLSECGTAPAEDEADGQWRVMSSRGGGVVGTVVAHGAHARFRPSESASGEEMNMVREVPRASVCVPRLRSSILMLEGAVDASRAEHLCASHGGGLPRARDPLLNRTVWEGIRRIPGYSRSFWLKPVDSPCFMVYATPYGLIPTDLQPCKDLALHLACEVPVSARYFLRRAGPPSTDDTFYLRTRDLTPLFLSPGGRRITLGEDGALTLTDAAGGREAWVGVAEGALGVLGRRNWTVGGNRSEEMALSVCARDQFTCSDGACVGLARRCDGVDDCGDESDEVCGLLLPLPLSYRRHRPPLRRTPVALTAVLGRILELDDAMNTLTVVLELSSRWRDPRVTLQQLSNNPLENELQLGELWVPEYNLDNAVFKDKISYSKGEGVKRRLVAHKNGSGEANVFGGYEAFFYSNSSSFLEYNETFAFSFDCEFDLELYPFDSHVCWIDLSVSRKGSFHAFFDPGEIEVHAESFSLPLFTKSELCFTTAHVEEGYVYSISYKVLLSRKYSAYVINTLGPCVLVAIIGYITLFFEQDNFSDRIMVTLSCFIVVATLFSQVAATTPSSASNKVIDTIFFWVMTRLFFIFLHHFSQSFMWAYVGRRREAGEAGVTGAPRASPEGGGGPPGGVLGGEKGASALAWAPSPLPAPTKADEAHARRVRRVRRVNRAIIFAMVAWDALATLVMAHDIVIRRQKAGDQFGECREFE